MKQTRKVKVWAVLGVAIAATQADAVPVHERQSPAAPLILTAAGEAGESGSQTPESSDAQAQYIAELGDIQAWGWIATQAEVKPKMAKARQLAKDLQPKIKAHKAALKNSAFKNVDVLHKAIKTARGTGEDVSATAMVQAMLILLRRVDLSVADAALTRDETQIKNAQLLAWGRVLAAQAIRGDVSDQEREEHQAPLKEIDSALGALGGEWTGKLLLKNFADARQELAASIAKIEFAATAIK